MYKAIIMLFVAASLLSFNLQAQQDHTVAKSNTPQITAISSNSDETFRTQLTAVYKTSQHLSEALVAADAKRAQQMALDTKKALSQVDMSLLEDKARTNWMNYQTVIKSSLDKIESEDKIKAQRKYFAQFSGALYKSIKAFGLEGKEVYYQHCPMALEGEGAYWLSDTKQIRNPYLGDKMLTCGSTNETIK